MAGTPDNSQPDSQLPLVLTASRLRSLNSDLKRESAENFNRCLQCRTCSAACPFAWAMDYKPNQVLRMIQFGLGRELLTSSTIWICVGCHTCTAFCPMAIDIPAVMDALRAKALGENAAIAEPDILSFHRQVLDSIRRHGRTHKLGIMMRYKFASGDFLSDMDVGLKMLAKGKLELMPHSIKGLKQVKQMFEEAGRD